ncbi:hypothetical protein PWT90_10378 [Aphanocladium album]|nr:hypothetical protein PWT90_10378 [Aphanocladium album]
MKTFLLGTLLAAVAASATASSDAQLQKRIFDGDSKFVFECNQQTIPDPVSGGGTSYFSQALYFEHNGQKHHPRKEDCTYDKKDATCQYCIINAPELDSPTTVKACYLPPAGKKSCVIDFYYGNRHYNANLDKDFCEKKVDATISNARITTTCYFNYKLAHPPTTTRTIPPWTPTPVPDPVKLGPNPKVLIVGDSITHGQEGDFTWRYRISEWFRNYAPDTKPEFVGPYTGTQERDKAKEPQPPMLSSDLPPNTNPRTSGGYHPGISFQSNHFAVWGRQIAQDTPLIEDVVRKYKPDIILVLLGFNDMGWFVSDAPGTLNSMEKFIQNARKPNPGVKMAIANVPQRSLIGGRDDLPVKTTDYNRALPALLKKFDSQLSPTRLVDVEGNYDCAPAHCPAGYDGLHPNAYGEYLIAQAFSRTLYSDFSVGKGQLQLPSSYPPRQLPVPSNIRAVPEPMGVKVTWDQVYESNSYDVRSRIAGTSDWTESRAGTNRHDQTFTVKGIKWEFQIRSSYGEPEQGGAKGAWSGIVSATADRGTPSPPKDIRTSTEGGSSSLTVSWGAVENGPVDRFGVIIWDRDTPGAFIDTRGARGSPLTIGSLKPGHRYDVWVETWGGPGLGGLPKGGNPVVVGGGTPSTPSGLEALTVDPTTMHLRWNAANGAAGYKIYTNPDATAQKTGSKPDEEGKLVSETNWGEAFLFPGTWHFEFCVSAVNGQKESSRTCATPPKASGYD